MPELIRAAMPFLVVACGLVLLLCLAPLFGPRTRTALGGALLLASLGFVVDVLAIDHTQIGRREIPNFFRRAGEAEPHRWVTAVVEAPAWHWHVFLAAMLALPGLVLLLRRRRAPAAPQPVLHLWLVFVWCVAVRLGLELTAAPAEIFWAVGGTPTLLVTLPCFGFYCGRRGDSFVRMLKQLLVLALLQRAVVAAWGWLATMQQLGTHLDTHVVTDVAPPLFGEHQLATPFERWLWPTLFVQMVFWVAFTFVVGTLLAALPRWLAVRRAARLQPALAPAR